MENLPTEITENILFRLPIEVALQAKRVCTTWRGLLRDYKSHKVGLLVAFSDFQNPRRSEKIKQQFFYEDEYDHYDQLAKIKDFWYSYKTHKKIEQGSFVMKSHTMNWMVGSCNGLVCFGKYKEALVGVDPFLICNPLTGESVFLPRFDYFQYSSGKRLVNGFGCCPSTNKYKVVTIYYCKDEPKAHVQVYTVGTGEWRYIGFIDRCNRRTFNSQSAGIYANGALYWLHRNGEMVLDEIVALDLEHEEFSYIPLPWSKNAGHPLLELLGGNDNLYLVDGKNYRAIDIWVYKRNHTSTGTSYSSLEERNLKQNDLDRGSWCWIKEFGIPHETTLFDPIAITRSNEVLLWYSRFHHRYTTGIYCYDPKTSTSNKIWDDAANAMKFYSIFVYPHTQSIVSLKDLGETNVTCLKDFERLGD